jgi:glycosyltransferase involved in cell wall biosynthesis
MNIIKTSENKMNIVVSWSGIPAYGARLIREGIKGLGQPVLVIGTMPQMSIKDSEDLIGQKIYWIDRSNVNSWRDLDLPVPDIFFQAGWFISSFNKLGKEVRNHGGKVVLLSDNCWKNNMRQWMGAVKYRLLYREWFSAVWVPGKSGTRLMKFFGVPSSQIYQGLYGSDPGCFTAGPNLTQRPKQFIFVGRYTPLKGVPTLVEAFKIFHQGFPDWKIIMFGTGECQNILENCPGIVVHPFAQPPQIADALRHSRFLVLPTLTDHWPLVVSEATLAGCGLLLSNRVGNIAEFLNEKNGFVFPARSVKQLAVKLKEAASLPDWRLDEVYHESLRLGSFFGPAQWAKKFHQIISEVGMRSL